MVVHGEFNKRKESNELDDVARELAEMTGFSVEELGAEMTRKGLNIMDQMEVLPPLDSVASFRFR